MLNVNQNKLFHNVKVRFILTYKFFHPHFVVMCFCSST